MKWNSGNLTYLIRRFIALLLLGLVPERGARAVTPNLAVTLGEEPRLVGFTVAAGTQYKFDYDPAEVTIHDLEGVTTGGEILDPDEVFTFPT